MRVLLLANHCNPEWPSTPYFGYRICRAIAEHVEGVVLATHVRNREAIERHGLGSAQVVYIDNEYVAAPMYGLAKVLRGGTSVAWTTGVAMTYPANLAFEWEVYKRFKNELNAGGFDVVHRVTPLSPTLPSPLAKWSPVPFVLGPVNGGLRWPRGFSGELKREREWMVYLRRLHRWLPYYQSTYKHAAAVLGGFGHTRSDLPKTAGQRFIDFSDVGFDPEIFSPPSEPKHSEQVTFLFAGRLVPYKCPDVAVAAFIGSDVLRRHRLWVVGEGPERPRLEQMVRQAGAENSVQFLGWQKQPQIAQTMKQSDVFVFPSVRELGAGVVLEAMGSGLPCVVADYGGPGAYIDGTRGIKVPLGTKQELVSQVQRAMETLAQDQAQRERLGAAARRYAMARHTWDVKASQIVEVYRWVIHQRAEKPDFVVSGINANDVAVAVG